MLTKEMTRCIAKISGDGNLYKTYVRYSNTCKQLRDEFKKDMKKEFGSNIHFTEGTGNSGTPFVQIHRKENINKFLSYLPDYRSNYIYIPNQIKFAPKYIHQNYLRAFYDDEGSPSLRFDKNEKAWKRSISLSSNSLRILQEVKFMILNDFNINTNKIIRNKPPSNYDMSYVLTITGQDNLIKFKNHIGFKHPDKIRRLSWIIKSYSATPKHKQAFANLFKILRKNKVGS